MTNATLSLETIAIALESLQSRAELIRDVLEVTWAASKSKGDLQGALGNTIYLLHGMMDEHQEEIMDLYRRVKEAEVDS